MSQVQIPLFPRETIKESLVLITIVSPCFTQLSWNIYGTIKLREGKEGAVILAAPFFICGF